MGRVFILYGTVIQIGINMFIWAETHDPEKTDIKSYFIHETVWPNGRTIRTIIRDPRFIQVKYEGAVEEEFETTSWLSE